MNEIADPATALQSAADLFAAAARRGDIPAAGRLNCLAAEQSLARSGRPLSSRFDALATDELITMALQALAALPAHDFSQAPVLLAARHGRRALHGRA